MSLNENKKGKFWKDMYIHHSPNVESGIISKAEPIPFNDNSIENVLTWEYHRPIPETIQDEFLKFVNRHNNMESRGSGITERMTSERFQSFIEIKNDCCLFLARSKENNRIMGCMIVIVCNQVHDSNQSLRFAVTTFLCVHKKLRGHGVNMLLIRNALKLAHSLNVSCSYYLVDNPFSKSAIKLKQWLRPIHLKSAEQHGFSFTKYHKPSDRNTRRTQLAYAIHLDDNINWAQLSTKKEIQESLPALRKILDSKSNSNSLTWNPSKKEWLQWCKAFPTLIVTIGDDVLGFVSIECKEIFIPKTGNIGLVGFIPYFITARASCSSSVYQCALQYASQHNRDVVLCYATGDLTFSILERNRANSTTGDTYVDFYNYALKPNVGKEQLFIPLL